MLIGKRKTELLEFYFGKCLLAQTFVRYLPKSESVSMVTSG
jgi:hypothetical protein